MKAAAQMLVMLVAAVAGVQTIRTLKGVDAYNQSFNTSVLVDDTIFGSTGALTVSPGSLTIKRNIERSWFQLKVPAGDVTIQKAIDGASQVLIQSGGNVSIGDNITGRSWVIIDASGDVSIGKSIAGQSQVWVRAGGFIRLGDGIDGSTVRLQAGRGITIGKRITNKSTRLEYVSPNITIGSKALQDADLGGATVVAQAFSLPSFPPNPGP